MNKVTRLDDCQFLLVSQTNHTLTYFAEHRPGFSHDAVQRYVEKDKLTARMGWENVRGDVIRSEQGYLAFDDMVQITPVRSRSNWYDGNTAVMRVLSSQGAAC